MAKGSGLASELIDRTAVELAGSSEAIPHVAQGGVVGLAEGLSLTAELLDRTTVKLVDALDLLGGEEIVELLVVLLADGDELFASLEVVLDGTLGLGIRLCSLRRFVPRGERPDLLLLLGIELYEPAGGGFVEAKLLGDVSRLDSAQALAGRAGRLSL